MSVKLITDSTASLTREFAETKNITVVPLTLRFPDSEYSPAYSGDYDPFYERLLKGKDIPKTSLPSPEAFRSVFQKIADDGDEAVCLTITSQLSGTYNSAVRGAEGLEDKIKVIDSGALAQPLMFLVEAACEMIEKGMSAAQVAEEIDALKDKTEIMFIPDSLEYLSRGGRISKLTSALASILKIKPVLNFKNGKFSTAKKGIGLMRAVKELVALLPANIKKITAVCIGENSLFEKMKQLIGVKFGGINIPDNPLSPIVAAHVGPGAFGVAFITG